MKTMRAFELWTAFIGEENPVDIVAAHGLTTENVASWVDHAIAEGVEQAEETKREGLREECAQYRDGWVTQLARAIEGH